MRNVTKSPLGHPYRSLRKQLEVLYPHSPAEVSRTLEVIQNALGPAAIELTPGESAILLSLGYSLLCNVIVVLQKNMLLTHENLAALLTQRPAAQYRKIYEGLALLSEQSLLSQLVFTALVKGNDPKHLSELIATLCCPSTSVYAYPSTDFHIFKPCLPACPNSDWLMALQGCLDPFLPAIALEATRVLKRLGLVSSENFHAIPIKRLEELLRAKLQLLGSIYPILGRLPRSEGMLPHSKGSHNRVSESIVRVFKPECQALWTQEFLKSWHELPFNPLSQVNFDRLMLIAERGHVEDFVPCVEYIRDAYYTGGAADVFERACEINRTRSTPQPEPDTTTGRAWWPERITMRGRQPAPVASGAPRLGGWLGGVGNFFAGFIRDAGDYLRAQGTTWRQERVDHVHLTEAVHRGPMNSTGRDATRDEGHSASASPWKTSLLNGHALICQAMQPDSLILWTYGLGWWAHFERGSVVNPLSHVESSHTSSQERMAQEFAAADLIGVVEGNLKKALDRKIELPVRERVLKFCQECLRDPSQCCDIDQIKGILQEHAGAQRVGIKRQEAFVQETVRGLNEGVRPFLEGSSERSARSSGGFFASGARAAFNRTTHDVTESVQAKPRSPRGPR